MAYAARKRCAAFLDTYGELHLATAGSPTAAACEFRWPRGLIGIYDHRAALQDIEADIVAARTSSAANRA